MWPHDRSGREPHSARSPLTLRLAIAVIGSAFCVIGAAFTWTLGGEYRWWTAFFGLIVVIGIIDILVIVRRMRG